MGTETDTNKSNPSKIQPLAEFDPNQEPVSEPDESDVIEPLKKTSDEPKSPEKLTSLALAADEGDGDDGAGAAVEIKDSDSNADGEPADSEESSIEGLSEASAEDSDDGEGATDEVKAANPAGKDNSSDPEEQPAGDSSEETADNKADEAASEDEAKNFDPDGDDSSSEKEKSSVEDPPMEPPAKKNETEFIALDDDEIDDGIDSKPKKEDKAAEGEEKREKTGKDPEKIKKNAPKKEPLPKGTANSQKTKKPAKDATPSKKVIVSIIIISMVVGAVIYSRPVLFGLQKKPEDVIPAKTELNSSAKQTKIQTPKPSPSGKKDRYLSKIEDVTRLREQLLVKKEEIYRLQLHYRNGIAELEDQLYREMQDADISTFDQALDNKRIELGLRTIQRREVYIQELEKPDQWVHSGSEELLFLKRKALLDLQMIDIASGIDLNRHLRYMNAAIQKYQPSADKLAVDPPPAKLTPLETIWSQIRNDRDKIVQTPIGQENKIIIAEICSGNYGRIAELSAITPKAAKCLARMNGSELFLNGLTRLNADEARYLFKWQGNWIGLNSVKNLTPAVAKYLFKWNGNWISLNGLTELPPEMALYLTEWQGDQLELMGLDVENSKPDKRTLKYLALWETMGGKLFVSDDIRDEMARVM